jgi:hypothetical protein
MATIDIKDINGTYTFNYTFTKAGENERYWNFEVTHGYDQIKVPKKFTFLHDKFNNVTSLEIGSSEQVSEIVEKIKEKEGL